MKTRIFRLLAGTSLLTVACAAGAQTAPQTTPSALVLDEIIVTARRRTESVQDVPQTVNAVTSEEVEKLNIQNFTEIQAVVPGLTMGGGNTGYTTSATIRGAAFQVESGSSPTVEFYLNDAGIGSNFLFQSMYDIGQVEVLRGPQGTLRGRPSPSGSITATTRRPNLSNFGGYVNVTATDQNAFNGHAGINLPIISDVLAVRVAGLYDDNEYDHVKSIHNPNDPSSRTKSGRVSLRFEPNDALTTNVMYQYLRRDLHSFDQYESFYLAEPTAPTVNTSTYPEIKASDRLGITDGMRQNTQTQEMLTGQVDYRFAGQKMSYVGSYNRQKIPALSPQDVGDIVPNYDFYQNLLLTSQGRSHELRLASEERVFGVFDYTVGAFYSNGESNSYVANGSLVGTSTGPFTIQPATAFGLGPIIVTNIRVNSHPKETGFFGNLTYHLGDRTEFSGGLRRIGYKNLFTVKGIPGTHVTNPDFDDRTDSNADDSPTVYNLSASHHLTEDFMVYANFGRSWRSGTLAVGPTRTLTDRLRSFTHLQSETSQSYEIGFKVETLEKRLRVNASFFHQGFNNYQYRGPSVYYVGLSGAGQPTVATFNFVANVPAKVDGAELEIGFKPTENFSLDANFSYAKGKIKNGLVACNDFNGDGVPDTNPAQPTATQIRNASGGANFDVAACNVSDRLSFDPDWTGTLQPEYGMPLNSRLDGFARALYTYKPRNVQDPHNPYDDVNAYGLLNLYTGVRSHDGAWEVSIFGKNITNTGEQLNAGNGPLTTGYLATPFLTGTSLAGPYMGNVRYTAPREFGINVRYAFGSR